MTTVEFTVAMDAPLSLPSVVFSDGIYAVELRIATGWGFVLIAKS